MGMRQDQDLIFGMDNVAGKGTCVSQTLLGLSVHKAGCCYATLICCADPRKDQHNIDLKMNFLVEVQNFSPPNHNKSHYYCIKRRKNLLCLSYSLATLDCNFKFWGNIFANICMSWYYVLYFSSIHVYSNTYGSNEKVVALSHVYFIRKFNCVSFCNVCTVSIFDSQLQLYSNH